jgi:hypothetical protein
MARELQVALVPREYPQLQLAGVPGMPPPLHLSFHHIYRAALEDGGDFLMSSKFPIIKPAFSWPMSWSTVHTRRW